MEEGVHIALQHAYRQRAQKTAWQHASDAIERLAGAQGAIISGDVPLAQDKLDEAYASVVAARKATGSDHHHRETV